jgi:hypothetical protein
VVLIGTSRPRDDPPGEAGESTGVLTRVRQQRVLADRTSSHDGDKSARIKQTNHDTRDLTGILARFRPGTTISVTWTSPSGKLATSSLHLTAVPPQ